MVDSDELVLLLCKQKRRQEGKEERKQKGMEHRDCWREREAAEEGHIRTKEVMAVMSIDPLCISNVETA